SRGAGSADRTGRSKRSQGQDCHPRQRARFVRQAGTGASRSEQGRSHSRSAEGRHHQRSDYSALGASAARAHQCSDGDHAHTIQQFWRSSRDARLAVRLRHPRAADSLRFLVRAREVSRVRAHRRPRAYSRRDCGSEAWRKDRRCRAAARAQVTGWSTKIGWAKRCRTAAAFCEREKVSGPTITTSPPRLVNCSRAMIPLTKGTTRKVSPPFVALRSSTSRVAPTASAFANMRSMNALTDSPPSALTRAKRTWTVRLSDAIEKE